MNYIDRIEKEIISSPVSFEKLRRQEWHNEVKTEIAYNYETISRIQRIAFICFAIIVFPVGLAILTHKLIGKIVFSGWLTVKGHQKRFMENYIGSVDNAQKLPKVIAKRINLLVDGKIVDAFICGKPENINNGKWVLVATGVGRCMEDMDNYEEFDSSFQKNYLFFNYPGVGASEGLPSKTQVVNTYTAMLHFLEDDKKGVGAKEIICWGRSIGGAIQAESLKDHTFKNEVKYTIIRDRTFSRLSEVAWYTKVLKFVGWEFDGLLASERLEELKKEEIILQTAHQKPSITKSTLSETERLQKKDLYYNTEDPLKADRIIHDGTISPSSSLAYALLSKQANWQYKKFISVSQEKGHYRLPSLKISKMYFGI